MSQENDNKIPMEINRFTLSFTGNCSHLEAPFRSEYFKKFLISVRLAILLAIIMYSLFGFLDVVLVPRMQEFFFALRFYFFCPLALVALMFTYSRHFYKYMQATTIILEITGAITIILMMVNAPPPIGYAYYAGLILALLFGFTIARLRFVWATAAGWFILLIYEVVALWYSDTSLASLLNNNFFFISALILGMIACYTIEYSTRRDFYLVQLLEKEQANVQTINNQLEQRVKHRTAQLEKANVDLKLEMRERQLWEEERKNLEERLVRAEKMEALGTLAGGVAHDLNNVLAGIVSYPDLLLEDIPQNSPLYAPLNTIKNSGEKAAAIVMDLLTLARRAVIVKEVVNINQVITRYLKSPEMEKLKYFHPFATWTINLSTHLMNISGSPVHLSKTLMNLVSNAAEALQDKGKISITTENCYIDRPVKGYDHVEEGDYVTLTVADTGIGIQVEDINKIFEPFYTRKKMGRSGTGLGMAVVWGTVKDHNGYIDVRSNPDGGSTFILYFPATRTQKTAAGQKIPIEKYKGNGQSILVVDDIQQQREIAQRMLSTLGYNVTTLESGEAAIDYLKQNSTDLLILDMIMEPGINGLETYKRILEFHPTQKAIITSGFAETKQVREAQELGAGKYIRKPYMLENIGLAVYNATHNSPDTDS